jgi:hypothetical protein
MPWNERYACADKSSAKECRVSATITHSPIEEVQTALREEFDARRHEVGAKAALHDIAQEFGLTLRRVRGFVYGEARGLSAAEYVQIKQRRARMLKLRLQRLDHEAEILRARLQEWPT